MLRKIKHAFFRIHLSCRVPGLYMQKACKLNFFFLVWECQLAYRYAIIMKLLQKEVYGTDNERKRLYCFKNRPQRKDNVL
jgi:hypothetical protein